jgi:hypothetical protein
LSRRLLPLLAVVALASCSAEEAILLTVKPGSMPLGSIYKLTVDLNVGGKLSSTVLAERGGTPISLPTDAYLIIKGASGPATITVTARGAGDQPLAIGRSSGDVEKGRVAHIDVTLGQPGGDMGTGGALLAMDNQPSYDFGALVVSTRSGPVTLTVSNVGTAMSGPLGAAALGGANPAQFEIVDDQCANQVLDGGATCTVSVRFVPTALGAQAATVQVSASPGGSAMTTIGGTAITPGALTVTPTPFDFGGALAGGGTVDHIFSVTNTGAEVSGPVTMALGGSQQTQFSLVGGTCMTMPKLALNDTCTSIVRFAPTAPGLKSATLTAKATPGGPGVANLQGTGLTPAQLAIAPNGYTFPAPVDVGGTPVTQTFTVTNTGAQPTSRLAAPTLSGDDAFSIANETCSGAVLTDGAGQTPKCTITVQLAPTAYGARSAMLGVSATVGGSKSVGIAGTGRQTLTLTVGKNGSGSGAVSSSPSGAISCGSDCSESYMVTTSAPTVTLQAAPDASSTFTSWTNCTPVAGTPASCTATVDATKTVTATFTLKPVYTLTVTNMPIAGASGAVISTAPAAAINCGTTCSASFVVDTAVTLQATPAAGSYFGGWDGDCAASGFDASCTVTLSQARAVTAKFTPANIIFVSSATYTSLQLGALGSGATQAERVLSGADAKCATLASSLPGGTPSNAYVAWLSRSGVSAKSRIGGARGWVRRDGKPFADRLEGPLFNGPVLYPPEVDETGAILAAGGSVWTASNDDGSASSSDCTNWSDTSNNFHMQTGERSGGTMSWSVAANNSCAAAYALYCLGTRFTAVVPPPTPPTPRKLAFMLDVNNGYAIRANGSLLDADMTCNTIAAQSGLLGTYKAMLATSSATAVSRFTTNGRPYVRPDGVVVVNSDADLFAASPKLLAPIGVGPTGKYWGGAGVFTGATGAQARSGPDDNCVDWSKNTFDGTRYLAIVGSSSATTGAFFSGGSISACSNSLAVYCMQEP